ncbi:HEAT repeat-containing protein 4-like [Actinia tenebrosa]|uniref:HEAT repeat-containing protein 4-like n=1 Tax=Actinia tenebrosa TaxID=6105 RepID=A0A6P8HTW1_ACTTE|nr:HEAT repeat-containing protein 4-like [Actinia tenebrosa]
MAYISATGGYSTPRNTVSRGLSPPKSHGAEFFPVASGVQVPYVGGDEFVITAESLERPSTYHTDIVPSRLAHYNSLVSTAVIQNSLDVIGKKRSESPQNEQNEKLIQVLTRNPPTVTDRTNNSVSKSYLKKISSGFSFSDEVVLSRAPHTVPYQEKEAQKVFKADGVVKLKPKVVSGLTGRHDPRGSIRHHVPCHLKGPRRLKPLKKHQITESEKDSTTISLAEVKLIPKAGKLDDQIPKELSRHGWDEFVLSSLSKATADWIVSEHISGVEKERLAGFLKKRYKDVEEDPKTEKTALPKDEPGSVKKEKFKDKDKDLKTEQTSEVHLTSSFFLPPGVGDKKIDTKNFYQQELLSGAFPLPSKKLKEQNAIVLDSNDKVRFKKHLQENFPQGAVPWFPSELKEKKSSMSQIGRQKKGLQRWKDLPSVIQDDSYINTPMYTMSSSDMDISELSAEYKQRKKIKEDINVVKIAEEWRSKWFLDRKWQNSTTEELLKAMDDINDHVRLAAVAACSKAAMIRKTKKEEPVLQGISLDKAKESEISLQSTLEPELFDKVTQLLQDRNVHVRIAAAITLYTLNKPNEQAESVLLWSIEHGGPPEKWAATQCLALAGIVCDQVINELVRQLHSDNSVRAVEAGGLLAELSRLSGIVQSLIAELLNSSSWKDRATACKVIPKLKGGINKDMTHKLSYLMWSDWSKEVRTAAAQALGKTGNGKLVHDALQQRITSGNERVKVDALKKLSNLGIMTVRLLPALLQCFHSEYVSVRIEAAMAAGQLKITDDKMLNELLLIASNDRSWKVKAHVIKALGNIGIVNDRVTEVLLWAIRYDKMAAVRAEACNAVSKLRIRDPRILAVLQDRLVVETDDLVKREAIFTLKCLGVEPTGDLEMLEAIGKEVRRLCTRDVIVSHIIDEDKAQSYSKDYKRLFTTAESDTEGSATTPLESTKMSREKSMASRATSQLSERGWDPILGGFQARERMSRAPTPGTLHMDHSYLPMDLNSASSENSSVIALDDVAFSDVDDDDKEKVAGNTKEGEDKKSDSAVSNDQNFKASTSQTKTINSPEQNKNLSQIRNNSGEVATQKETTGDSNAQPAVMDKESMSAAASAEDAQDLCSDVDSNKEDPELLGLEDDFSEKRSVAFSQSEQDDDDDAESTDDDND